MQEIYLEHDDIGTLAELAVSKKQVNPLVQQKLLLPNLREQLIKIADA